MPYVTLDDVTAFRCESVLEQRWNGWRNPLFTREQAAAVADWLNWKMFDAGHAAAPCYWEGDTLVVVDTNLPPEEGPDRFEPDDDGLYAVGNFAWTWSLA